MPRSFSLSQDFDILWRAAATDILTRARAADLKKSVMKLSDHFIQEAGLATPWNEPGASDAYTLYFHPLNYLRARRAVRKAHEQGFFAKIHHFVDWGCGLGALTCALRDELPDNLRKDIHIWGVDQSQVALDGFRHWNKEGFLEVKTVMPHQIPHNFPWEQTCLGMSYSLNEISNLGILRKSPEGLLILEPSTFGLARNLQKFRAEALGAGYFAWSPCPHQATCPLLTHSRKDWCFDRLHLQMPEKWDELFADLPIKNKTVTLSHLALRRSPPTTQNHIGVRLVGDDLAEKGKVKWLACAGETKFFLVWPTKWGEPPPWKRGDLLKVDESWAPAFANGGEVKVVPEKLDHIQLQF